MASLLIATTLAPFNIENQKKAMDTWIKAGFDVVSLNCTEEIEILKPYFSTIKFIEVNTDARELLDKPYVYMDSFMNYFQSQDIELCGIVNSDVYLKDNYNGFKNFIIKEAKDAFVYLSRFDVESLESEGIIFDFGFDMFFFDKRFSYLYPKTNFCLGQPGWDYWIIYIAFINKINVKKVLNSVGYHIKHHINWIEDNIRSSIENIMIRTDINHIIDNSVFWGEFVFSLINLFEDNSSKLVYQPNNICDFSKKVLILHEDYIGSNTINSIKRQSYKNYSINRLSVLQNMSIIEEDYIIFLENNIELNEKYLEIMLSKIENKDYVYCGYNIINNGIFIKSSIYNFFSISNFLFSKKMLENLSNNGTTLKELSSFILRNFTLDKSNMIGLGLVRVNIKKILDNINLFIYGNVFIYAAGGHTQWLLDSYPDLAKKVTGIFDSNKLLHGKMLSGIRIYDPINIQSMEIDHLIISSHSYEDEIYEHLSKIIDPSKLIRIYNP